MTTTNAIQTLLEARTKLIELKLILEQVNEGKSGRIAYALYEIEQQINLKIGENTNHEKS